MLHTPSKGEEANSGTPYYTPSLARRFSLSSERSTPASKQNTPGLKFLVEEAERLTNSDVSCNEDSSSPTRFQRRKASLLARDEKLPAKRHARKNIGKAIEASLALQFAKEPKTPEKKSPHAEKTASPPPKGLPVTPGKHLVLSGANLILGSPKVAGIHKTPTKKVLVRTPAKASSTPSPGTSFRPLTPGKYALNTAASVAKVKRAVLTAVPKSSPLRNHWQSNWEATHDAHNYDQLRKAANEKADDNNAPKAKRARKASQKVKEQSKETTDERDLTSSPSKGNSKSVSKSTPSKLTLDVNLELVPQLRRKSGHAKAKEAKAQSGSDVRRALGLMPKEGKAEKSRGKKEGGKKKSLVVFEWKAGSQKMKTDIQIP